MTTQTIQPDEIEHEEEVVQQSQQISDNTVCEVTLDPLDPQEEEVEDSSEQFQLEISEDSDCEDKEYLGGCIDYSTSSLIDKRRSKFDA